MSVALLDPPTPAPQHEWALDSTVRVGCRCRNRKGTGGICKVIHIELTGDLLGDVGTVVVATTSGWPAWIDIPMALWVSQGWEVVA